MVVVEIDVDSPLHTLPGLGVLVPAPRHAKVAEDSSQRSPTWQAICSTMRTQPSSCASMESGASAPEIQISTSSPFSKLSIFFNPTVGWESGALIIYEAIIVHLGDQQMKNVIEPTTREFHERVN